MTILLGIPTYDDTIRSGLAVALIGESAHKSCPQYTVAFKAASLLAMAHNELFCLALNNRPDISHLLIVHSDILPEPGFIGQIMRDMKEAKADLMGAIVPIKDSKGLTSTALLPNLGAADMQGRYEFRRRRLTLYEATKLPDIFDVSDVKKLFNNDAPDAVLLVNTAMLLINVMNPLVEQLHFEINDAIFKNDKGQFYADVEPEDWHFSRQAAQLGLSVCVTRRVGLRHVGKANFPNKMVYGEWQHDEMYPGAAETDEGKVDFYRSFNSVKLDKENGQHEKVEVPR